jgi:mRNA interferase MazF
VLINPSRGDVWNVELDPTRGDEMGKTRPAVVLNSNQTGRLRLRFIVPITGWHDRFARWPWIVRIQPSSSNGLSKTSAADTFQARGLSLERFRARVGVLPAETVAEIAAAIALVVEYEPPSATN